jgi:hypothetical protein
MGSIGKDIGNIPGKILQGVGLKDYKDPYAANLGNLQGRLEADVNNPMGIAANQYQMMANQGLGKTLATIASQRSLSASERANMAGRENRDMQQQIAAQAGLLGLEEQAMAKKNLADFLLMRSGAGMQSQQEQGKRLVGTLGAAASAAGAAAKSSGGAGG